MRYFPPGFIGTESAILILARARQPERWPWDLMVPPEKAVWSGINVTFNGFVINPHLFLKIPDSERVNAHGRLLSFLAALQELRGALHSGSIVAWLRQEDGSFDHIQSQGWGGDGAEEVLLTGLVDLEDGSRRLVLLQESCIAALIDHSEAGSDNLGPPSLKPLVDARQLVTVFPGPVELLTASQEPEPKRQTTVDDTRAAKHLATLLQQDEHLTKAKAKAELRSAALPFSETGFNQRVWPRARQLAGLSEKAPPGPKPSQKV